MTPSAPTAASGSTAQSVVNRLVAKKGGVRSEATIQSDVRMLLLDPELGLAEQDLDVQLETQVGNHRRIDVEVGCTVIEVKRSLSTPAAVLAAASQLADYVITRADETGQRYVGVLTDGRLWIAYHEVDSELREATRHTAAAGAAGATSLLRWLEGVLATKQSLQPTPAEIAQRLGADSSSHALDYATLAALYKDSQHLATVQLKRDLWANLLRSALGTQFTNSDDLFLEHTLLVNSAEIIAHLVLGLDAKALSPSTLLSGDQFTIAGLNGVVDRDFFDWVLEVPGGDGFITALARRLARFDWSSVDHDVLKVLYEEVIPAETRRDLGEYYTPDWLANRVVSEVVTDPLNQRVLDPSCGSGTFVFYAARRFLAAAEASGWSLKNAMERVTSRVMGIDLHPVAVALARVTYLLALGRDRLNAPGRGDLSVPIYLGDSLGWTQREEDILTVGHLVIPTETGEHLLSGELRFPDHLLADGAVFDSLINSLVDEAGRAAGKATSKLSEGTVRRLAIAAGDLPDLNANFARLKELHEADRDHIWSYYIRNVARPVWLSREENRVDVLVGNPPWLAFRHMTAAMQATFKAMAQARGFWHDMSTATHQDLAGLFVARAVERYLKMGGRLAFVVPNSVIDRDYWGGFRQGRFDGANLQFSSSWDLRRIRPHLFPRGSAVIFGTRAVQPAMMPTTALIWSGRAPHRRVAVDTATLLRHTVGTLTVSSGDEERSPYSARFSQGANLVPRLLFRVEPAQATALGVPAGRAGVRSKRSAGEKKPWKELPALTGTVETEFIWPTVLGEHIVPYRMLPLDTFVIPLTRKGLILAGDIPRIDAYPGLAKWTRDAEELWKEHGGSSMSLTEQIDHFGKLTQQVPVPGIRVVYAASGMHVSAALVTDPRVIVEHAAYWAAVATEAEGRYLVGILNSPMLTEVVRPLMSYGKDERHIDKHVWKLPIPVYDPANDLHLTIARLAGELATDIADHEFTSQYFVTMRQQLRQQLLTDARAQELNDAVVALLDVEPDDSTITDSVDEHTALVRMSSGRLDQRTRADVEIDIDCEFDRTGKVYLWGVLISQDGGSGEYRHFGDVSPRVDEGALARAFHTWLVDLTTAEEQIGRTVRWFHYGPTEWRQLRRLVPDADHHRLEQLRTDVLTDLIRPHFFAPTSYSLKHLAPAAGASWSAPGVTGADTLTWIDDARADNPDQWSRLVTYNEEDVRALRLLRHSIATSFDPGWQLAQSVGIA